MGWTIDEIPDLSGLVSVVVEPHCPRGESTVRNLLLNNAHVVLVSTSPSHLQALRVDMLDQVPHASLGIVAIEEASSDGCMAAARAVLSIHPRVDMVVNNSCPVIATTPGHAPAQFHLLAHHEADDEADAPSMDTTGLYAFTATMMPGLLASDQPRIVTVVSDTAAPTPSLASVDTEAADAVASRVDAAFEEPLSMTEFTRELNRRLVMEGSRVQSMVVEPAVAGVPPQRTLCNLDPNGPLGETYARQLADRVAMPQLQAATDPHARGGDLYTPTFSPGGPPMRLRMPTSSREAQPRWNAAANATGISLTTHRTQLASDEPLVAAVPAPGLRTGMLSATRSPAMTPAHPWAIAS